LLLLLARLPWRIRALRSLKTIMEIRLLRESELQKAGEQVQRPVIEEREETFPLSLETLLVWIILIALVVVQLSSQ